MSKSTFTNIHVGLKTGGRPCAIKTFLDFKEIRDKKAAMLSYRTAHERYKVAKEEYDIKIKEYDKTHTADFFSNVDVDANKTYFQNLKPDEVKVFRDIDDAEYEIEQPDEDGDIAPIADNYNYFNAKQ